MMYWNGYRVENQYKICYKRLYYTYLVSVLNVIFDVGCIQFENSEVNIKFWYSKHNQILCCIVVCYSAMITMMCQEQG